MTKETLLRPGKDSLDERIEILEAELTDKLALVEAIPDQFEWIESQIALLEPKAEQANVVASLATHLRVRLDQVQSTLNNLRNNGNAGSNDIDALLETASILNSQLLTMEPHAEAMNQAGIQVRSIKLGLPAQQRQVQQTAPLIGALRRLLGETNDLKAALPPGEPSLAQAVVPTPRPPAQPDLLDVRDQLPQHPAKRYHTRDLQAIRRIVVHQTGFSPTAPPTALARVQIIRQDAPGITYHFVINGNGDIFWTQSLEQVLQNTLHYEINADSVSVALAGDFSSEAPSPIQLAAAADVIAWLVTDLGLEIDDVLGRSELEAVISPGSQWRQGARYKRTLLGLVRAKLVVE